MADIIIPNTEPVVREAVAEKTFNEIYILDLSISAKGMDEGDTIYINYCPFDRATGDRLISEQKEVRLPFWQTVGAVPEASKAFEAVADAVPVLIAFQKSLERQV